MYRLARLILLSIGIIWLTNPFGVNIQGLPFAGLCSRELHPSANSNALLSSHRPCPADRSRARETPAQSRPKLLSYSSRALAKVTGGGVTISGSMPPSQGTATHKPRGPLPGLPRPRTGPIWSFH